MDKVAVAREVAAQIWTTEASIDAAISECAALIAKSHESRAKVRLSPTADDAALAKIIEAMAALSTARSAIVDAHNEAADLAKRMGIRRTQMIGIQEKADDGHETAANLTVVTAA